jgi:predicted DNA repair protein MutK
VASGIFAILDDIAALMDDVAHASQVATAKTAGILGDDLAVNAEKATGFLSEQELPVIWAITKGSFLNKLIIIPLALVLNVTFPIVMKVMLVLGGVYLAYEGAEKIVDYFIHRSRKNHPAIEPQESTATHSQQAKIKSAIRTDFVLSIEIVIIALGAVLEKSLAVQILVVAFVSLVATVGVYGLVALIVRMDDTGFKLIAYSGNKGLLSKLGHALVRSLPVVIRALGVVGTIALLLVSGGIFTHNFDYLHHLFPVVPSLVSDFSIGLIIGLVTVAVVAVGKKVYSFVR